MKAHGRLTIGALALPLFLSGCGLIPMKRHLPVPKAPARVQTATPEELVDQVNKRWDEFQTLTATVEMQATLLKAQEGLATDYPSVRGWIVMQKPSQKSEVTTSGRATAQAAAMTSAILMTGGFRTNRSA